MLMDFKSGDKTNQVNSVFNAQKQINAYGISKYEDQKLYTKDGMNFFSCVIPAKDLKL